MLKSFMTTPDTASTTTTYEKENANMDKYSNAALGSRVIAENMIVSNDTRKTQLNNNDLIIGPSGSGKTGGYVVPNLLCAEHSVVCADTKGNLYTKFREDLEARGFSVYKIDFTSPEEGSGYDPLKYVSYKRRRNGSIKYNEQDILSIANTLLPIQTKHEPFWESSGQTVLCCLISYVLEVCDDEDKNLATVADLFKLLTSQAKSGTISFLDDHSVRYPDSYTTRKYHMFRSCIEAERTFSCICQFVSTALDIFDTDCVREMMIRRPDFMIHDLGRRKCAVFLEISDTDPSLYRLANIFYTQCLQTLCREADAQPESRLRVPTRIILDDFACSCQISNFDNTISIIRSRDIYTSIILQSMSQLTACYSKPQADTIVNNCDHILYLGGSDLDTVKYISARAGVPEEKIMYLEVDKVYVLERGSRGQKINKTVPYSMLKDRDITKRDETQPCA